MHTTLELDIRIAEKVSSLFPSFVPLNHPWGETLPLNINVQNLPLPSSQPLGEKMPVCQSHFIHRDTDVGVIMS